MAKRVRLADNKHAFAALLDEACRLLDPPIEDEDRRSRLRALAGACKLSDNTLILAVERTAPPDLATLAALAANTTVPLTSWLLSLRLLDTDDITRGLARNGRPDLLSEQQLQALALVDGLGYDQAFPYLAVCGHIRQLIDASPGSVFGRGRRGGAS